MTEEVKAKPKGFFRNELVQLIILVGGMLWTSYTSSVIGTGENLRFFPISSMIIVGIFLVTRLNSLHKPLQEWIQEIEPLLFGAVVVICVYVFWNRMNLPNVWLYVTSSGSYSLAMIFIVWLLIQSFATKPIDRVADVPGRYFLVLPLVLVYSNLLYKDYLTAAVYGLNVETLLGVPLVTGAIIVWLPLLGWFKSFSYFQRILTMLFVAFLFCLIHGLQMNANYVLTSGEFASMLWGMVFVFVLGLAGLTYYLWVNPEAKVQAEIDAKFAELKKAAKYIPADPATETAETGS